jgi:hypothetical protein
MPDIDLAAADPVAVVVARLRGSDKVKTELGFTADDDVDDHIGLRNVVPYPRLIVSDPPGGSLRGLRWLMSPIVQVEAVGDLDGRPGAAALRRLLLVALQEVAGVPETPSMPGEPVVTNIGADGSLGWVPLPNGQPRYLSSVQVFLHPPLPTEQMGASAVRAMETAPKADRRSAFARRDTKPAAT